METLLVIDVVNAYGVVLLQTVWAVTPDVLAGRRRSDVERIADPVQLIGRLQDLVTTLYEPITLAAAALKSDQLVGKAHPPRVIPKTAA